MRLPLLPAKREAADYVSLGFPFEKAISNYFNVDARVNETLFVARDDSGSITASKDIRAFAILIEFRENERSVSENYCF